MPFVQNAARTLFIDFMNKKSKAAVMLGSEGGKMNVKKHGAKHMRKLSRLALKTRWKEKINK